MALISTARSCESLQLQGDDSHPEDTDCGARVGMRAGVTWSAPHRAHSDVTGAGPVLDSLEPAGTTPGVGMPQTWLRPGQAYLANSRLGEVGTPGQVCAITACNWNRPKGWALAPTNQTDSDNLTGAHDSLY